MGSGYLHLIFNLVDLLKRFFGLLPARFVTIVFSTSAGFIFNSHFLTADIPLLFWMLLAFYFAQTICFSGKTINYIGAGFFTGIATATKYNGLAVGISIVVAHSLVSSPINWKKLIFSKNLVIGLAMVPVGFLAGNPFALLDYHNFISDFLYNYMVTPLYDGNASTNRSYGKFFWHFSEIIGFPALVICGIACLLAIYFTFSSQSQEQRLNKQGLLLLLSVFLLYYYKFGAFPRLEVRFVLPIIPFVLMVTGPFWQKVKWHSLPLIIVLFIVVTYNVVSSFYVGKHFAEAPRMAAQVWVKQNIPQDSSIESQYYTPNWNLLEGVKLANVKMPVISGRKKTFEKTLKLDAWLESEMKEREQEDSAALQWYSLEALNQRHPDFIALNSIQYNRFLSGRLAATYPMIAKYFQELIAEKYSYKIVFDQKSEPVPKLLYSQKLDFVDNRIIVLKRA